MHIVGANGAEERIAEQRQQTEIGVELIGLYKSVERVNIAKRACGLIEMGRIRQARAANLAVTAGRVATRTTERMAKRQIVMAVFAQTCA